MDNTGCAITKSWYVKCNLLKRMERNTANGRERGRKGRRNRQCDTQEELYDMEINRADVLNGGNESAEDVEGNAACHRLIGALHLYRQLGRC
jgi:hypothetical protein